MASMLEHHSSKIYYYSDGAKMSKRKKNYPEPTIVVDQFGADAVR